MTAWTSDALAPTGGSEWARWGVAGAVVLAAHALAFAYLRDISPAEPPLPAALEQSMEVEMAPIEISAADSVESEELPAEAPPTETLAAALPPDAVAPTTTETLDAAPPEQLAAAEPETLQATTPPETLEAAPPPDAAQPPPDTVEPLTPPETAQPVETTEAQPVEPAELQPTETLAAEPLPPSETVTAVPSESADAVLPEVLAQLPETRPVVEPAPKPVLRREQPRPRREQTRPRQEQTRPVERRAAQPRREQAQAAAPRRATRSAASTAQRAARAPKVNPAAWQGQVRSRVSGRLSRLRGRGFSGRVSVVFTVSPSGSITGARVLSSSGNGAIDRAAVGSIRGLSVPVPPPGVGRTLNVSVSFKK